MVQVGAWRSAQEWCKRLSWRSLRFPALFLVSVALLTLMYRLRSDRIDKEEAEKALKVSKVLLTASVSVPETGRSPGGSMTLWPDEADLSEVASHERWVVVSGTEDEGGRGGGVETACSLAAAVKAQGWRPIVIGEGLKCCRLPDCVPLDSALLSRLPYRVLRFINSSLPPSDPPISPPSSVSPPSFIPPSPTPPSPLRNAAFLFAIQHGARFVFDAYPPKGNPGALTSWTKEVFSSMALGTSVGLVLDGHSYTFPTPVPGAPAPRILNPYAHFGRLDLWAKGYDLHDADEPHQQHLRYRVCEIRQPSVEMFLDVWDGGPADLIAPPITVPSSVLAPYGSQNVLYTRDAFWGLALFPGRGSNASLLSPRLSPHLARALWNHALLGATSDAGGVRFTLMPGTQGINSNKSNSVISRLFLEEDHPSSLDMAAYVATFTSRVLRWRCRSTTLLPCLSQLASDFLATSLLTAEDAAFMEAWVTDLRRVRYLPPPTLPWSPRPPPRPPGPCIHPPHHHHRQSHDPPLPHPTTLTFHPINLQRPATTIPASVRMLIARFHRDAALLEWSVGSDRTEEEVALVEETLTEDKLLSDEEAKSGEASQTKGREDNSSRKAAELTEEEGEVEEEELPEEATDQPLSQEVASTRTFLGDIADHLCPGFASLASPLLPHRPSSLKLQDVLLVVWFPRPPRYDLLPALELLRSRHFPNALFCGPPHRALPSMLSRFDGPSSPSFLTATSRSDCLLTALEMGYRVGEEGSVLLVEESALPIPWSLSERNRSLIWFHTEKEDTPREKRSTRDVDGKGWEGYGVDFSQRGQWGWRTFFRGPEESVIMAAEGLASSLRFMARLMGVRPSQHLHPHHHPMEDIEHEDGPWNRMPGSVNQQPNVTENNSSTNETSPSTPETLEVENTTLSETLTVIPENATVTSEIPAVEKSETPKTEKSETPLVEHIDTPSVEYSEPTVVEYSEPPVMENHKTPEVMDSEPPVVEKSDTPKVEHVDTPAVEYSEPSAVEHVETPEIEPVDIKGTFDAHGIEQENGTITEETSAEDKLDVAKTVTIMSDALSMKYEVNASTEWPPTTDAPVLPWNDTDTKFEPPANLSSSDWVTSAEAEEILSSITMIENAPENNTEEPSNHDEVVTEYFVNTKVNLTYPQEETNNSTIQQAFEIKSSELYEEDKDEEESVGDGEQSLLEQDTLLSYKDVEDSPQFVSLPSSTAKSHAKSIDKSVSESDSIGSERKKRDATYSDGKGDYSMDGIKEQFMKSKESQEEGADESRSGLAISARLSRSLQEIEELFAELASGFPEDAEAVLKEEGNPDIMLYPTPHYGLDHTDFRHLHCDYGEEEEGVDDEDWGESESPHFEPCTVLRRFFLRLHYSHQSDSSMLQLLSLATTRGSAPIFHLPIRLQREFHLTASLLLSQGFPEEAVLPLLVYGLAGEKGWVNLKKGSFGDTKGAFPVFEDNSDFIHPTNLRTVPEESRLRSVFCLKFLLRVLDG